MISDGRITDAVVLLAGAGSRLATARGPVPKPLVPVLGRPLISYVLNALEAVGVHTIHAVVGANAEEVALGIEECLPARLMLNRIDNREWRRQNGISLLAAATAVDRPFLLAMGDHLFETSILRRLIAHGNRSHVTLAVDRKISHIFDLTDAMKVRTVDDSVAAIAKDLSAFDAIDTGLFVCPPEVFDYLESAKSHGDCSLADGLRLMAQERKVDAMDIGDAWWQDVDTPAMLQCAEQNLPESLRVTLDAPVVGG